METENNIYKSKTYHQLRVLYNCDHGTFTTWLNKVPDLNREKRQRRFTPEQVRKIITHLGEP